MTRHKNPQNQRRRTNGYIDTHGMNEARRNRIATAFRPLLEPASHTQDQLSEARSAIEALTGQHWFGKRPIYKILNEMLPDPFDARSTELGDLIPDRLPLRTKKEAWQMVTENKKLVPWAIKKFGIPEKLRDDATQELSLALFDCALYHDSAQGTLAGLFIGAARRVRGKLKHERALIPYHRSVGAELARIDMLRDQGRGDWRARACEELGVTPERLERLEQLLRESKGVERPLSGETLFYSLPPQFRMGQTFDDLRAVIPIGTIPIDVMEKMGVFGESRLYEDIFAHSAWPRVESFIRKNAGMGEDALTVFTQMVTDFNSRHRLAEERGVEPVEMNNRYWRIIRELSRHLYYDKLRAMRKAEREGKHFEW